MEGNITHINGYDSLPMHNIWMQLGIRKQQEPLEVRTKYCILLLFYEKY